MSQSVCQSHRLSQVTVRTRGLQSQDTWSFHEPRQKRKEISRDVPRFTAQVNGPFMDPDGHVFTREGAVLSLELHAAGRRGEVHAGSCGKTQWADSSLQISHLTLSGSHSLTSTSC